MDWWHWGAVTAISVALLCEAWYGLCQFGERVKENLYGQGVVYGDVPGADRAIVRIGEVVDIGRSDDGEPLEQYAAIWRLTDRMVVYSALIRGIGRIMLAAFVIAGFADRVFEFPWLDLNPRDASPGDS